MASREFGDPSGVPAIYFHGTPSSAYEARWLDPAARKAGVRILAFDRTTASGSLLDGAREGVAIADSVGVESFATVGFSGGTGFALAAAYLAPERVTVVHCAGGLAAGAASGIKGIAFSAAARAPWLAGPLLRAAFRLNLRGLDSRLSDPRAAALWFFDGPARGAQVAAIKDYVAATDERDLTAELQGVAAAAESIDTVLSDLAAYARPWPFDRETISVPVEIWHGEDDPAAPIAQARRLAEELPDATLHAFADEGHFVIHSHAPEIAASIRTNARVNKLS